MVVRVGLVELEHGELGIVLGGDAFVAEVPVDLVHAIESADDQALEIELRRDAQEERDVERVVVGGEGPGHGAAGDGLHHRRFDLDVAARIKEVAQGSQHLRALDEYIAEGWRVCLPCFAGSPSAPGISSNSPRSVKRSR